ncbi:unnamed protein product [Adineta ricciae]|uniref:Uncharacterized protein n=1 Tax=Adineta ricciae TaxID=249248 RepID=A0A814UQJ2_ADIRI|nr:unnamed protein product [Adineta ricciae]
MHMSPILSAVLIVVCCVNFTFASGFGVDCKCTCCISSKKSACKANELGSIHLDIASCDDMKCLSACKQRYPLCTAGKSDMQTTCTSSGEPSSSSSTMTSTASTGSSSATSAQSSSTTTGAGSTSTLSTSSTTSASSTSTPSTSATTSSTTTSGSSTVTSTTSGNSTTLPSNANAIKSMFQFSYFILFITVFTFFRM